MLKSYRTLRKLLVAAGVAGTVAFMAGTASAYTIEDYNEALAQQAYAQMEIETWTDQEHEDGVQLTIIENNISMSENQCGEDPDCFPRWEEERAYYESMYQESMDEDRDFADAARSDYLYWTDQVNAIREALGLT
ncbi:hypothetical protein [Asticcacaulis solisilvae]|uniref:hypothetical protein n=1 Tax=Asticcacaulis solisilvae TaxID=1217274 RepID=UPI003FD6F819